jgi:hypothetical protein
MQNDTAKARAAYQHFLTLWKDADPDIPILRQAKAEYEKLTATASTSASVSGRETKEEDWLPSYRTFCFTSGPQAKEFLLGIQQLTHLLASRHSAED